MARRTLGPVEAATKAELAKLGRDRAAGGLAVAAVTLARKIDEGAEDAGISPAQLASAVKELRFALVALNPPVPAGSQTEPEDEGADDLKKRREQRHAGR